MCHLYCTEAVGLRTWCLSFRTSLRSVEFRPSNNSYLRVRGLKIKPPPTHPSVVTETDLMYGKPKNHLNVVSEDCSATSVAAVVSSTSVCYCRQTNHFKHDGTQTSVRRCFRCGKFGETIPTCSCGSGNESSSR